MTSYKTPRPLFDTIEHACAQYKYCQKENHHTIVAAWLKSCLKGREEDLPPYAVQEYYHTLGFLYNYRGSMDTFYAYRRELERFIQWSWFVHQKSILELRRLDIEAFIEFCQKPPKRWISTKIVHRFTNDYGERVANPDWRPFVVKVSKKSFQDGERAQKEDFVLSQQALKQIFSILSAFYNALIQDELTEVNPILQIRQKSKFIRQEARSPIIRRLSNQQWQTVLNAAHGLYQQHPQKHNRTLFIVQALYGMYLRISELAATPRWQPKMSDFFRDSNKDWWFKTVGKGNKMRQIAVSPTMLQSLKDYRESLGYLPLPAPDDKTPLIGKEKGQGAIKSTRIIRKLVQLCFDEAVEQLRTDNQQEEAEILRFATVHWLRHTGISDDVKHRPREHVRDDAGHSSSAITDRYVDVELKERAKSAQRKVLKT